MSDGLTWTKANIHCTDRLYKNCTGQKFFDLKSAGCFVQLPTNAGRTLLRNYLMKDFQCDWVDHVVNNDPEDIITVVIITPRVITE